MYQHQIYPSSLITYGALAQLVEQRTFNPFVVGSTPARPTNIIKGLRENVTPCCFISSRIVVLIYNILWSNIDV